ncbi:MAG TPA: type II secretion system protein GspC [Polyangiaceae bacterium]|nr:type II secretion system protein GspC [Polyangiaceae bacterium]
MDSLLKKYFAAVVVALLALAAYFQAAGATQLVGAAFVSSSASAAPARPVPTFPTTSHERRTAQPILDHNPFDSANPDLNPKPEAVASPAAVPQEPDLSDPLSAPSCDGIQAFIITESTDPEWSVAALQGSGEPRPRMRRVGDDVGGKQVAFIGFNPHESSPSVWLEQGATVCQVLLFKRAGVAPAPATTAAAPPPVASAPPASTGRTGGPPAVPADIASKIQKISETEYQVDRSVVDKILENQAELMRSARIVPEQKDGKVVGVRMFGIRPDTLLGTLGLQNGDRLESINGFNMASPEKALEAYARLRTASSLNVKVNRRGQSMNIDYQIK